MMRRTHRDLAHYITLHIITPQNTIASPITTITSHHVPLRLPQSHHLHSRCLPLSSSSARSTSLSSELPLHCPPHSAISHSIYLQLRIS